MVIANLSGIKGYHDREAARRHFFLRKDYRDKDFCFKITVKAAIRERGVEAKTAIVKELEKIMEKKVWHGVHISSLSKDQRARILNSHMFLKDKIYITQHIRQIQGATCCERRHAESYRLH